ncbi:MAG: DUF2225 domain-containing protein [candidate division Zixibacteria bacterium]|nr:DUF2225 domain-containing protein [candidate division Zixibacteria bacterium]
MSKDQEPFFYSTIECPVCKTKNKFENIRAGSYTESGKDTDFCPTGRVWQDPLYQAHDPLMYFMATCKECFYTREFNNSFKKWQNDTSFKTYRLQTIKEKHLKNYSVAGGVIQLLGLHIDTAKYPFESSVNKFLLGIYDELLVSRPSYLDIGRFFLRIAWLFRGNKDKAGSQTNAAVGLFAKLRGSAGQASKTLPDFADKVQGLKELLDNDFTMKFEDVPEADEYKKRIEKIISEITDSLNPLKQAGDKLMDIFNDAEKALMKGQVSTSEQSFFEYPGYFDFLSEVKKGWDEVPFSENDALIKANEYYQKSYESGGQISNGLQQIQAAYLIGELSRRTKNHKNAAQYFNQMVRMGRELVMGKKGDASTLNFAKKLLEMGMDQARLNKKEHEGSLK